MRPVSRSRRGLMLGLLALPLPVLALDVTVGSGTAASCTEAAFDTALGTLNAGGGGRLDFACGALEHVVMVSARKTIEADIEIDGGGRITFDGNHTSAFFQVFSSRRLLLRNIVLARGTFSAAHALENFGELVLESATLRDTVSAAPAVANYGVLRVLRSRLVDNVNSGSADGGAILHEGTLLRVEGSELTGNAIAGNGYGGAISYVNGNLEVIASSFANNAAANGGAIHCGAGSATVEGSSFLGNSASGLGGAIASTCHMQVRNSSFFGNQAQLGGGFHQGGSTLQSSTLDHVTIAGNSAVAGAGIYNEGSGNSSLVISRSVLSGNADGNCDGVLISAGYNLSSDSNCAVFVQTGDAQSVALPLQPLGGYGSAPPVRPLAEGSAALDAIPPLDCSLPTDQHGRPRPEGAGCDAGAVEGFNPTADVFSDDFEAN